jgi:dTMP kinase
MTSVREVKRGLFIAMEGMDGSGKSEGAKHFGNFLREEGLKILETREVGGTPFGEKIRSMIFTSNEPVDPMARFLAILAARQQHVTAVIKPAIESGISVLSDRFNDTTFVYQAMVDGLESAYYELAALRNLETIFKRADITVLFKVDAEVAYARGTSRVNLDNDQYKRGIETARKVARGYQIVEDRMSVDQKRNLFVVDGNQTIEQVHANLRYIARHIVRAYLDPK